MSFDEKNTWIFGVIAVLGYATYLVLVFSQLGERPLADADYVAPMLGTILGGIVAGILGAIALGLVNPKEAGKSDRRDKQIEHFGDRVGNSFIVLAAIGAMILAWLQAGHFWIANLLYLGFILAAILSSVARLVAYRRGLQEW